ncbi:WxL protein peptidoglycan domain-containing protein [Catellatospora aurea]|uniref:WxL protein peptidoglycan domain-containing protein n=1 Tax=Catellatospora aurea TaxID=1337874 RepID=A0ABW2GQ63_9ACTN
MAIWSRTAAAALAAALLAVMAPIPAHAAGNGRWAVVPTPPDKPGPAPRQYFFLESPPGRTVIDSVRVANLTDRPMTLRLYGADAFNTSADGGFGLLPQAERQRGIGAWTQLGLAEVVVPAKRQTDIPFTITVPANAPPGDHVGGVVAAESTPSGQLAEGGMNVGVTHAVAARVYLRVSGPTVPGLAVEDLAADPGELTYTLANTGNIHLLPELTVTSSGLFGHTVTAAGPGSQLDLVPGARTRLRAALRGVWPVDIVTTTVTATAEGGVRATSSTTTVTGVLPALGLLALLAAAAFLLVRRRRRARRLRPRGLA